MFKNAKKHKLNQLFNLDFSRLAKVSSTRILICFEKAGFLEKVQQEEDVDEEDEILLDKFFPILA